MQVKVFEAADMATGLKMVRQELGPDALILSTRTIRSGKLGLLGRPILEITAAIDTPSPRAASDPDPAACRQATAAGTSRRSKRFSRVVGAGSDPGITYGPDASVVEPPKGEIPGFDRVPGRPVAGDAAFRQEMDELKNLVRDLAGDIARIRMAAGEQRPAPEAPAGETAAGLQNPLSAASLQNDPLLARLHALGIAADSARTIAEFARESLTPEDLDNPETVDAYFHTTIRENIAVQPPDFSASDRQRRVALIGPTGVGKTTTLAKLAAHYLSRHSPSIALITIDTYRIAAVEQLKVYGEIMHLPVEVVISPEQLEQALQKHRDKELVLIDTAGRSPRDAYCIEELAAFLRSDLEIEKHLVLSATTRELELTETVRRFDQVGINRLIFTKIDECSQLGSLFNIQIQYGKPLSFVTNGQRVPEDLIEITPAIVASLIMSPQEGSPHD
ncbi:MAG: flagellar biosynthesis protein FlhF [Desulfobulbaceae bacterium]|nr:MAG: flagellar biosynthesis protein FlhF [Desulfobulbaceae bacterium]